MENYYQSENPTRCATGCGLFGTAATMNMCSTCYQDYHLNKEQSARVRAVVTNSLSSSSLLMVSKSENSDVEAKVAGSTKAMNRCGCCNKKVGVVGYKCRCGHNYCVWHRYPESHSCDFDYKLAGKLAIAKANPLVVADKLQRF